MSSPGVAARAWAESSSGPAVAASGTVARTTSGPLLRLEGLSRSFGARRVLDGLSFDVAPGEIFGLLGPNGAGKSTVFALLAGLLKVHGGRLFWRGDERGMSDPRFRAELGLIFQRSTLDDQLTARENLMLGAQLYGVSKGVAGPRVESMLQLIELADRGHEKVGTWSGGMRRRLELVRALLHRPRLLLMDEPTQGLDETAFRKFWAHLRRLRSDEGLTVLLTTHRSEEAAECDRLAVLDAGKLLALDTPAALAARVGGDVVTLEVDRPEEVAQELETRLGLTARVSPGAVHLEHRDGHTLIPRLVEAFPVGRFRSVQLRRPTLADVFVQLTGKVLGDDVPARAEKRGSR